MGCRGLFREIYALEIFYSHYLQRIFHIKTLVTYDRTCLQHFKLLGSGSFWAQTIRQGWFKRALTDEKGSHIFIFLFFNFSLFSPGFNQDLQFQVQEFWSCIIMPVRTFALDCNQGRKQLTEITATHFLWNMKGKLGWFINVYNNLLDHISSSECLVLSSFTSHLKCPLFFVQYVWLYILYCDLGKWLRVPRHGRSCCGGPGRERSCSCVQRRPGYETPRQGWPGNEALFLVFFSLFISFPAQQLI